MTPVTFSVSEVRVAATCPRISYFDFEHTRRHRLKTRSVTRLWKAGAERDCLRVALPQRRRGLQPQSPRCTRGSCRGGR